MPHRAGPIQPVIRGGCGCVLHAEVASITVTARRVQAGLVTVFPGGTSQTLVSGAHTQVRVVCTCGGDT